MPIKTPTETTDGLATAATRARDALAASRQMMEMLREYAELEAQHATRLHALAQRMGDCIDRMRDSVPPEEKKERGPEQDDGDELRARQNQCVAVVDEVVTFLTRFGSMHRHLSECLANDLFDEWGEILSVQEKRMDGREPELDLSRAELEESEKAYGSARAAFYDEFEQACSVYAGSSSSGAMDPTMINQSVQDLLEQNPNGVNDLPRIRSPSKAMQYMGSLSRRLLKAGDARRHSCASESGRGVHEVSLSIARAEKFRLQCQAAFLHMHRLQVRHSRLCDSLHQEYACVQGECFRGTRNSIRKLVIHVSAFTSNLQHDANQLFHDIELLQENDLDHADGHHPSLIRTIIPQPRQLPPPLDVPLGLDHVVRRRFPIANLRPRLLKHQNACHILSVGVE